MFFSHPRQIDNFSGCLVPATEFRTESNPQESVQRLGRFLGSVPFLRNPSGHFSLSTPERHSPLSHWSFVSSNGFLETYLLGDICGC